MGLKAPSKLGVSPSRFTRLPNKFTRSSKITQTVPTTSVPRANIKVVLGVTADHSSTFTRSANIGVAITASATGLNTGGIEFGTAVVSVGITSTASANVTRSGVASIDVGITSTCTGALTVVTHTGTADIQVNIDIVASGLTDTQIPDETANANVMTLYGGATLTDDAAIGTRAVRFDGTNDYGLIDDTFQSTFQSPFSVGMWVKPDDGQLEAGLTERLFSTYETPQSTVTLYYLDCSLTEDGDIRWVTTYYNGTNSSNKIRTTTSPVFSDGAQSSYKHLIVTVDADGVPIIYIDGSAVALTTDDNDTFTIDGYTNSGTTGTKIGAYYPGGSAKFNGKIDDVSIWSTELSSTDVTNLYNSGSGTSLTGSSNLVGWWKMGEGSAMPLTHTGTATISASITASATGASVAGFSNAYVVDFDGSNDRITTSFDTYAGSVDLSSSGFTTSCWVKFDSFGSGGTVQTMLGRYIAGNDRFSIEVGNGVHNTKFNIHAGGTYLSGWPLHGMSTGTWYNVVVTYKASNTTVSVYVDTVLKGSGSTGTWVNNATRHTLNIGSRNHAGTPLYYLNGLIDEVAIWDTDLSSSNITALYNSGNGPIDATTISNCVAYWRMGDGTEAGSGSTVYDMSSNSYDGTLVNGASFNSSDLP